MLTIRPKETQVACRIGIDGGGTKFAIDAFPSSGDSHPFASRRFETQQVDAKASNEEKESAHRLDCDSMVYNIIKAAGRQEILSISIAVAGNVSDDRKYVVKAGTIVHWEERDIVSYLQELFGCPVSLGNDAEALVLAETFYGLAGDKPTLGMIWGTGVGGAYSKFGRHGLEVYSAEPGHMDMRRSSDNPTPCGCGSFSCLESHIGGRNILARHGDPKLMLPRSWDNYFAKLAWGIESVAVVAKPKLVVLGGGVSCKQQEALLRFLKQYLSSLTIVERPEVIISSFGESAGTVGALALGRLMYGGKVPVC
jgi:predicted NBD/HSP70 family sugar kinase